MSVNLQKGQKISLVKPGEPGLKRIMVGLGWEMVHISWEISCWVFTLPIRRLFSTD